MAQNFRHAEILSIARDTGKVTVEGLAAHFNVTAQTIRRDLAELCDIGQLTRVHGGAMMPSGVIALGYEARRSLASTEKEAIARMVAEQIPDGVSIFMNIGTTTEAVARALLKHRNLMVITNNLNVANILAQSPNVEVIVAGGILRRSDGALVGDVTAEFIGQFKVDYAIIGSAAVDPDGSLLDLHTLAPLSIVTPPRSHATAVRNSLARRHSARARATRDRSSGRSVPLPTTPQRTCTAARHRA